MKKILVLIMTILLVFTLSACDEKEPELIGDSEITIEVGGTYTEEGTTEEDEVTITGSVDTTVIGVYTITYSYTFEGEDKELTRTVNVVDTTDPVITLVGDDLTIEVGQWYTDPGFTADDNYDGDLTSEVSVDDSDVDNTTPGTYTIDYEVTDSSGNKGWEFRDVDVVAPNVAPTITLLGDNPMNLTVGDTYTDPGFTATDPEDGDIATSVVVAGDTVDTSTAGTYYVTYDVVDSDSVAATTVTRTVNVNPANTAPTITLIGDATVNLTTGDIWTDPGAAADDPEEGSISSSIVVGGDTVNSQLAGTYVITYNVTDGGGLSATEVTRTVIVTDPPPVNQKPVLTLNGDAVVSILVGETYTELGASASDPEDGNITFDVLATELVDTSYARIVTIEYNVTDSEGLAADTITRTVHIVEVLPNLINRIYIQKGLDIDYNDALVELGATVVGTPPVVDTDVSGDTTVETDLGTFTVTVYNSNSTYKTFLPNSLIYYGSDEFKPWDSATITIPHNMRVHMTITSNSHASAEIWGGGHGGLTSLSVTDSTVSQEFVGCAGSYYFEMYMEHNPSSILKVKIEVLELVDFTDPVEFDLNKNFLIATGTPEINTQFTVDVAGEHEITVSTHSEALVLVYDDSDNLIFSKYKDWASTFIHKQHFAVGTYRLVIIQNMAEDELVLRVDNTNFPTNFGPYDAIELVIDVEKDVHIDQDRVWFSFDAPTDGLYKFNIIRGESYYFNVQIYDEDFKPISDHGEYVYLEAGPHYVMMHHSIGYFSILVEEIPITITTNNTDSTATTINVDDTIHVFFDGHNTTKWYTFTIAEQTLVQFIYQANGPEDGMISLYEGSTLIFMSEWHATAMLDAGTYHILLRGEPNILTQVSVRSSDATPGATDMATPEVILTDTETTRFLDSGDKNYFELTLTEDTLLGMMLRANDGKSIRILDASDNVVYDRHIYFWERFTYLEAGTYLIELRAGGMANEDIYTLTLTTGNDHMFVWSTDINNPTIFNPSTGLSHFALDDTPLYQQFTFTEPTLFDLYIDNVDYLNVYENGILVHAGSRDNDDLFPIVLPPGTYLFEFIPEGEGIIGTEGYYIGPIGSYDGTFTAPSPLEHIFIQEIATLGDPVDVLNITVTDPGIYRFDTDAEDEDIYFYLIDSNNDAVISDYYDQDMVHLDAGTYTLIIQTLDTQYSLYIENFTDYTVGDDFASATEIYVMTQEELVFEYARSNFLKFYVGKNSYLSFSMDCSGAYQVFDSSFNLHDSTYYTPGDYYIELVPWGVRELGDDYCKGSTQIIDMSSLRINNTMETAIPVFNHSGAYGVITDPMQQIWYEVVIPENSYLYVGGYSPIMELDLYNDLGNLVETDLSGYYVFPAGVFYIHVNHTNLGDYNFHLYTDHYEDAPGTFGTAQPIEIIDSTNLRSLIEHSGDEDYYTFTVTEETLFKTWGWGVSINLYDGTEAHVQTIHSNSLVHVLPGTYFIKISAAGPTQYDINIYNESEYIGGDSFANATVVLFDSHQQYHPGGNSPVYYKMYIPCDCTIGVSTPFTYTLYDETETEVIGLDVTEGYYYFVLNPMFGGSHSLWVYESGGMPGPGGSNDIINTTYLTPHIINNPNFNLIYQLEDSSDHDFFQITLQEDTFFDAYSDMELVLVDIFDDTDTLVYSNTYEETIIYLDAGTYIIEVSGDDTLDYELGFRTILTTPISPDETAPTIINFREVVQSIVLDGEAHYIQFTLTEQRVLDPDLDADDLVVDIYSDATFTTSVYDEMNPFIILDPGTYYVKIHSGLGDEPYYFYLEEILATPYPTDVTQAPEITITTEWQHIHYLADFEATYVKFITTEDTMLDIMSGPDYAILDHTYAPYSGPMILPAGTYYIEFDNTISGSGLFTVRNYLPLIKGDTTPEVIELGELVYGYGAESQTYEFELTTTSHHFITPEFFGEHQITIIIKDTSDNELYNQSCDSPLDCYMPGIYLAPDTYKVFVTGVDMDYYFRLLDEPFIDHGNQMITATPVEVTDVFGGMIQGPADVDVFEFEITGEDNYVEIAITGTVTVVVTTDAGMEIPLTSGWYDVPIGTYYIRVTGDTYNHEYELDLYYSN